MNQSPNDKKGTPEKRKTSAFDALLENLNKKALPWPIDLPKPKQFPATLKDFLRLIVKAKTPADCTARLRRFFCERGPRNFPWLVEKASLPPGAKPLEALLPRTAFGPTEKQLTQAERENWAASEFQAIKDGDRKGGYFDELRWISMGSAYRYWWKAQKSMKARESAKRRNPNP